MCPIDNKEYCVAAFADLSDALLISKGVPQGTISGPAPFNIYLINITRTTDDFPVQLYDTTIYTSNSSLSTAVSKSQAEHLLNISSLNTIEIDFVES